MYKLTAKCILFFNLCIPLNSLSQAPTIQWQHSYGGTATDESSFVISTYDGGFIMVGKTKSNDGDVVGNHGDSDFWIVKLDSLGNNEWKKCYGGSMYEAAGSVIQSNDGSYVVSGSASSSDGDVGHADFNGDYWIIKVDNSGTLQWEYTYGGTDMEYEMNTIIQTSDEGYIVSGTSESTDGDVSCGPLQLGHNYWIVKLDSAGHLQWQNCFGGTDIDEAGAIKETTDHSFIITGYSSSQDGDVTSNHGSADAWVIKIDSSGNLLWQKSLGGSSGDLLLSSLVLNDGNYFLLGTSNSTDGDVTGNHGDQDFWLVKLDTAGNLLWQKCFGGSSSDLGKYIEATSDGNFILGGITGSNDDDVSGNHGDFDFWLLKIDSMGNIIWQKCLGGSAEEFCYRMTAKETGDGGYIMSGFSASSDGDLTLNHGGFNCGWSSCPDYWIVKLNQDITRVETNNMISDFSCFYNPIDGKIHVSFSSNTLSKINLSLVDLLGRSCEEQILDTKLGINEFKINAAELCHGLYILNFYLLNKIYSFKVSINN